MKINNQEPIFFLVIIAGRQQEDDLVNALLDAEVKLLNITYAQGAFTASVLKHVLGIVPEKQKSVITCMVTYEKSTRILDMLVERFFFDSPNTGIAFTIPIEELSF